MCQLLTHVAHVRPHTHIFHQSRGPILPAEVEQLSVVHLHKHQALSLVRRHSTIPQRHLPRPKLHQASRLAPRTSTRAKQRHVSSSAQGDWAVGYFRLSLECRNKMAEGSVLKKGTIGSESGEKVLTTGGPSSSMARSVLGISNGAALFLPIHWRPPPRRYSRPLYGVCVLHVAPCSMQWWSRVERALLQRAAGTAESDWLWCDVHLTPCT